MAIGLPFEQNPDFVPERKNENAASGRIICRCQKVTEGEIRDAILRGARTIDGVKRRCAAGMGRCQGGWCEQQVMEILAEELSVPVEQVKKDGPNSYVFL